MTQHKPVPPVHLPFDETFRDTFRDLVLWRRDVRPLLKHLVEAHLALISDLAELVMAFVDGGGPAPASA